MRRSDKSRAVENAHPAAIYSQKASANHRNLFL